MAVEARNSGRMSSLPIAPYPNVSSLNEWIMREPRNLGFDRRKDSGNFRLGSLEVLG
jgi:hypothetical protein